MAWRETFTDDEWLSLLDPLYRSLLIVTMSEGDMMGKESQVF